LCIWYTAVASLSAAVQDAMEHAIPSGITNSIPHWYSIVPQGITLLKIIIFTDALKKEIRLSVSKFVFLS
jgi:hypothetical protein